MSAALDLFAIDRLTGGRMGIFDVCCPSCGPRRRKPASQRKPVLRIWRVDSGFASFHCARCGDRGYARNGFASAPDPVASERARAEAAERERVSAAERLSKARWLWSRRRPLAGSIAETYLREVRGYRGLLPATLAFLPARGEHGPAMIAAFALPDETDPAQITIPSEALRGVHRTDRTADHDLICVTAGLARAVGCQRQSSWRRPTTYSV
jgi:hypothetical protein